MTKPISAIGTSTHDLPLVRQYFAGEYVDPTLLRGGLLQELDDLRWDQHCDDWSKG